MKNIFKHYIICALCGYRLADVNQDKTKNFDKHWDIMHCWCSQKKSHPATSWHNRERKINLKNLVLPPWPNSEDWFYRAFDFLKPEDKK